ncbi:hypothetical protein DFH28DRAFT_346399 [Melampsora americana]|nr:hypothetical protein DFH28DRAFT_346399 [Melampsora americana]
MQSKNRQSRPDPDLARLMGRATGESLSGPGTLADQEDALRQLRLRLKMNNSILDLLPFNAATSLALSLVTNPRAVQAISQCLLQIVSNSSPTVLKRQCLVIVNSILTSMSHLVSKKANPIDQPIAISYQLRVISTMMIKVGSAALIDLSSQIDYICHCYQFTRSVQDSSSTSTNSFNDSAQRQNSMSTTASTSSRFIRTSHLDSQSKVDLDVSQTPTVDPLTQLRIDAITLLKNIAEVDSKALHPFWAQLLPAHGYPTHQAYTLISVIERDPEISVRIRACTTIRLMLINAGSYLAIAEEDTTKFSFISLSAQIASITIELHHRLGCILRTLVIAPDLTEALLDVSITIVINSAYRRIKTPILESLLKPIVDLLKSSDRHILEHTRLALTEILNKSQSNQTIITSCSGVIDQIVGMGCEEVFSPVPNPDQLEWWSLLTVCMSYLDFQTTNVHSISNLRILYVNEPTLDALSTSKLTFLGALAMVFPTEEFDEVSLRWIRTRLRSGGLQLLVDVASRTSQGMIQRICEKLRWELIDALKDPIAVRLIGIIISKAIGSHPTKWLLIVSNKILVDLEDVSQPTKPEDKINSTWSWTMANCAERLINSGSINDTQIVELSFWIRIVAVAERLMQSSSPTDSQRTNGVRICGVGTSELLRRMSSAPQIEHLSISETVQRGVDALCQSLTDRMPKVQWNAVASMRQILNVIINNPSSLSSNVLEKITSDLCDCLKRSESYKVRIQISLSLQLTPNLDGFAIEIVRESLEKVKMELKLGNIVKKELDHAHQLHSELIKVLNRVSQIRRSES